MNLDQSSAIVAVQEAETRKKKGKNGERSAFRIVTGSPRGKKNVQVGSGFLLKMLSNACLTLLLGVGASHSWLVILVCCSWS